MDLREIWRWRSWGGWRIDGKYREVRCCETGPGGREDGRVILRSFHGDPDCAPACSQRPR